MSNDSGGCLAALIVLMFAVVIKGGLLIAGIWLAVVTLRWLGVL